MTVDGRRQRGERTRRQVAHRAAEIASIHGLAALSLGQLATDLRLSKSGIAALFGSKQDLYLAVLASGRATFIEHVVAPTQGQSAGLATLWAVIDNWFSYAGTPVFPGGCFMMAALNDASNQPGPIRDTMTEFRAQWLGLLTRYIKAAQSDGHLTDVPPHLLAIEVDAIILSANIAAKLTERAPALATAHTLLELRLPPVAHR